MVESKTVRIPTNLFKNIQKTVLRVKELQYDSPYEFIIDAIKRRIEEILHLNISSEEKRKEEKIISDFNFFK